MPRPEQVCDGIDPRTLLPKEGTHRGELDQWKREVGIERVRAPQVREPPVTGQFHMHGVARQELPVRLVARGMAPAGVGKARQPGIEPFGECGHHPLAQHFHALSLLHRGADSRRDRRKPFSGAGVGELGLELQAVAPPRVGSPDHTTGADLARQRARIIGASHACRTIAALRRSFIEDFDHPSFGEAAGEVVGDDVAQRSERRIPRLVGEDSHDDAPGVR